MNGVTARCEKAMPAEDSAAIAPPRRLTTSSLVRMARLTPGPRERLGRFGLVFGMPLGRHDEHGLSTDHGDQVLQAGHVIIVKRVDGGQVDNAAAVFTAQCSQRTEQILRRPGNADLVLLELEIGGELVAASRTVKVCGDGHDFSTRDRSATGQFCSRRRAAMPRRANEDDVAIEARKNGIASDKA